MEKQTESQLQLALRWVARLGGILGALIALVAIAARLGGTFQVLDFQTGTLMQAGMAVMLMACVAYLALIVRLLRHNVAG